MPETECTRRTCAVLTLAAGVLLALSACGGGNEGGRADDPTTEQLVDFSIRWSSSSGRITYNIVTTDNGDVTRGGMTLYWAPPSFRYDIAASEPGDESTTVIISTPEASYFCTAPPDSDGFCFAQDSGGEAATGLPFVGDFSPDAIRASIDELGKDAKFEASSRDIAGINATCFAASGALTVDEPGTSTLCFSDDGLLLLVAFDAEDGSSDFQLEASAVGQVSDSDFEPPYTVADLGDIFPSPGQ